MDAIYYSKSKLAFTLLDLGFNPNQINLNQKTPLMLALSNKLEDLSLKLIAMTDNNWN